MGIITISREFGSGGREIGKRLADEMGYAYYDKEIVTAIAEKHINCVAMVILAIKNEWESFTVTIDI